MPNVDTIIPQFNVTSRAGMLDLRDEPARGFTPNNQAKAQRHGISVRATVMACLGMLVVSRGNCVPSVKVVLAYWGSF